MINPLLSSKANDTSFSHTFFHNIIIIVVRVRGTLNPYYFKVEKIFFDLCQVIICERSGNREKNSDNLNKMIDLPGFDNKINGRFSCHQ